MAERVDPELRERLRRAPRAKRLASVIDWHFARYAQCLEPCQIVRYEDMVSNPSAVVRRLTGVELGAPVCCTPTGGAVVDRRAYEESVASLLRHGRYWSQFYSREAIRKEAARLLAGD